MLPENKGVKSPHVPEVVQFGHVSEHVVEVVGVGGVLTLRPPKVQTGDQNLGDPLTCQVSAPPYRTSHSQAWTRRRRSRSR